LTPASPPAWQQVQQQYNAFRLQVPDGTDYDGFVKLMDGRTDWIHINLRHVKLTDEWLEAIAECADLENLNLNVYGEVDVTAEGLLLLQACKKLASLGMITPARVVDDTVAAELAAALPNLQSLLLWSQGSRLSADGLLELVRRAPNLSSLQAYVAPEVGDDAYVALTDARTNWNTFILSGAQNISDRGLEALARCPELTRLRIHLGPGATDAGLGALGRNCRSLNQLFIDGGENITDEGLKSVTTITTLHGFAISGAHRLTDEGFLALRALPNLWHFRFHSARLVTDDGLAPLLEGLSLGDLQFPAAAALSDRSLFALAKSERLYSLDFAAATGVTDEGLKSLARHNPNLSSLDLRSARNITDAGLDALAGLEQLYRVNLSSATGLTEAGLARFRAARPGVNLEAPAPLPSPMPVPELEEELF
jgi:hypothetical protein